jgi:uncharacterized protein (DUF849 family)
MKARTNNKVIISCAITGSIHAPTMSDALPVTPAQISEQALAAAKAGAAIVHLHARDPKDGRPTRDPHVYLQFLTCIKQQCDAVPEHHDRRRAHDDDRGPPRAAALRVKPEMCSLNMGSMNFGILPMANRYKTWKHGWEEPYLRNTVDFIFRNTFGDMERIIQMVGKEHGARFEHECYDVGHLYNLAHIVDRKLLEPPFFIQTIFGILGRIGAEWDNVLFVKRTADRLWRRLCVVDAGSRPVPDAIRHAGRDDGRQRPRWLGGQPLHRARDTRGLQCGAGCEDPTNHRRTGHADQYPE